MHTPHVTKNLRHRRQNLRSTLLITPPSVGYRGADARDESVCMGRLKTQVRKTKVPEDGICKYGIRKYESATVENVSTAT